MCIVHHAMNKKLERRLWRCQRRNQNP